MEQTLQPWYFASMHLVSAHVGRNNVLVKGYIHEPIQGNQADEKPAILICPGGAYRFRSWTEEDPVALHFLAIGYNVFLLSYSVKEDASDLHPLEEASEAIVQIRLHQHDWYCDPHKIVVMGFSAGAHVAGSLANLYALPFLGHKEKENRPDACILCYPVITMGKYAHAESRKWVTGGKKELIDLLSLENQVHDATPPTFIWHTFSDNSVPVENSLVYANALRMHGVPFDLHVFSEGKHGQSMCNQEVGSSHKVDAVWVSLCDNWLAQLLHLA